jgi:uncharacterized protein YjbI with pentapeptide repeats
MGVHLSVKPRSRRQGLRKLSPDFIGKAADETATQVTRVGLTFFGTAAFCLLSLLSPDSALLGGTERINVPLAGPVSFFGFMLLGPTVLIVLRVFLQIYVEHSERWDRLARSMSLVRGPMLGPLQHPLIRLLSGLIFYLLLPLTMLFFAWKAAVFPRWGLGLLGVAAMVIASHVMLLPLPKFSWRAKALLSTGAAFVVAGTMVGLGLVPRPFQLFHANLSGHWLAGEDLRKADLRASNLSNANLRDANLSGANLVNADLRSADLSYADLRNADLWPADLRDANLSVAKLSGARLGFADLSRAELSGANLVKADLSSANLSSAGLSSANLSNAVLNVAHLSDANLSLADLSSAKLSYADLSNADLIGADLSNANLSNAKLRGVKNLTQAQLDKACGNADTKLPEGQGLTLKACPANP